MMTKWYADQQDDVPSYVLQTVLLAVVFSSSSLDVAFVASAVYHKYNLDVVDIVPFDVVPVDAVASTVAMALA